MCLIGKFYDNVHFRNFATVALRVQHLRDVRCFLLGNHKTMQILFELENQVEFF